MKYKIHQTYTPGWGGWVEANNNAYSDLLALSLSVEPSVAIKNEINLLFFKKTNRLPKYNISG